LPDQSQDHASIIREAEAHRWFHSIPLGNGYVTKGKDRTGVKLDALDELGLPRDMSSKRVLDIGAWDGFFTFEAERRGAAEVVALDHVEKSVTRFEIAARALGSTAQWKVQNLYHLDSEEIGRFDIVLCLGVIYHLRHILLGLDRVRSVMNVGADLFLETASIDAHVLQNAGNFGPLGQAAPKINTTPLMQLYPGKELGGDPTNVFAPNLAGLNGLLHASEFEVVKSVAAPKGFPSRAMAHARAAQIEEIAYLRDRDRAILTTRQTI